MSERIALSITVSAVKRLFGGELRSLVELARRAEDAGVDQIAMTDHLAIGPRTDRYPYGAFPFPNSHPIAPAAVCSGPAWFGSENRFRATCGMQPKLPRDPATCFW